MALITEIIPEQGFEKVGDVIGAILKIELENQKTLQGFSYPINVFSDRVTPFDKGEEIMINVLLDSANYSNINESANGSKTNFFIDVHASGYATNTEHGGETASKIRNKFLGMCRYILQSTKYKTLGFDPADLVIGGSSVDNFDIFNDYSNNDGSFVTVGRINFSARINEGQETFQGVLINECDTQVKLELTEKGYKYKTA